MAGLVNLESAVLKAAVGRNLALPTLRKLYFENALSGGLPAKAGIVDGTSVGNGQVGQVVSSTLGNLSVASGTTTSMLTLTLPAGVWGVTASCTWRTAGDAQIALNTSAVFPTDFFLRGYGTVSSALSGGTAHSPYRVFNVTADTPIYFMGNFSAAVTAHLMINAIRIQ